MISVVFSEAAELELNDAAAHYEVETVGLGVAFIVEVEKATRLLSENVALGQLVTADVRKWPLPRFPYALIYKVSGAELRILAVANFRRRPFYWRGRT